MIFNSIDFAIFLPIVFALFWSMRKLGLKWQNGLLLLSSYLFYGWWDWRFLSLIFFSTLVDYSIGLQLPKASSKRQKKGLLLISLVVNLGLLGFFKYYNFFLENLIDSFTFFGYSLQASSLKIILPVGISFYTFQTLSYSLDIYREKIAPTRDFIAFSAFVSFFPQLVAGPIERASHLLPQFQQPRKFNSSEAVDGVRQILWGLFKKVVIADSCASYVNEFFQYPGDHNGSALLLGAIFFAFQIYGDFSGYSDIAIGTARLFNFDLMRNFSFPYFSRDIAEFWRRWHISLSTWFRDYLYIPLGGSRGSRWFQVRNTFIIFLVSGFWHGANWTFIVWGGLNALFFLPLLLFQKNRNHLDTVAEGRWFPNVGELAKMSLTFILTSLAWIFFRAESLGHAFTYLGGIIDPSLISWPDVFPKTQVVLIGFLLLVEWRARTGNHGLSWVKNIRYRAVRIAFYYFIVALILLEGNFGKNEFIYFQF